MAIQAALTGNLVLSTLHTNDAPSSIIRLIGTWGCPAYLIKATVLGVNDPAPVADAVARSARSLPKVDEEAWRELNQALECAACDPGSPTR